VAGADKAAAWGILQIGLMIGGGAIGLWWLAMKAGAVKGPVARGPFLRRRPAAA
jgi:hypothetical protein